MMLPSRRGLVGYASVISGGIGLGLWLGSSTAEAGSGLHCLEDELLTMSEPVVTLVEGSGDQTAEQVGWEEEEVYFQGGLNVGADFGVLEKVEP